MSLLAYPNVISTSQALDPNYDTYIVNAQSGNVTLTLPTITVDGVSFTIVRNTTSNNNVSLTSGSSNITTVNGTDVSSILIASRSSMSVVSREGKWVINSVFSLGSGAARQLLAYTFFEPNGNYYLAVDKDEYLVLFSYFFNDSVRPRQMSVTATHDTGSGFTCSLRLRNLTTLTDIFIVTIVAPAVGAITASTTTLVNDFTDTNLLIFFEKGNMSGNDKIGLNSFSLY